MKHIYLIFIITSTFNVLIFSSNNQSITRDLIAQTDLDQSKKTVINQNSTTNTTTLDQADIDAVTKKTAIADAKNRIFLAQKHVLHTTNIVDATKRTADAAKQAAIATKQAVITAKEAVDTAVEAPSNLIANVTIANRNFDQAQARLIATIQLQNEANDTAAKTSRARHRIITNNSDYPEKDIAIARANKAARKAATHAEKITSLVEQAIIAHTLAEVNALEAKIALTYAINAKRAKNNTAKAQAAETKVAEAQAIEIKKAIEAQDAENQAANAQMAKAKAFENVVKAFAELRTLIESSTKNI